MVLEVRHPDGTTASWERTFNVGCNENEWVEPQDLTKLFRPGMNALTVTLSDVCGATVGTSGTLVLTIQ